MLENGPYDIVILMELATLKCQELPQIMQMGSCATPSPVRRSWRWHVVTLDFNYDGGMGKVGQASRSRTGDVISCLNPADLL
jgi:hypothetical protein